MKNRFNKNNKLYASRLKLLQRPDARGIIYPGSLPQGTCLVQRMSPAISVGEKI